MQPLNKFKERIAALEHALTFRGKIGEDAFYFYGISKSFEVCLEYAWKFLLRLVKEAGLESYGPKETIKHAGRLGLIEDVNMWLEFIEDRNLAVHDYIGIANKDYLNSIEKFLVAAKKLSVR